jgi:protein-tyrosine phosphatase
MEIIPVDADERLFISPAITDWESVAHLRIETVIDLEGGLDPGVPTAPDQVLYVYFPIDDDALPDLAKLRGIGKLGASMIRSGHRVLSHCGMGYNRSALVAGVILHELGMEGPEVVSQLRERRPGALFNELFASYLESLTGPPGSG